MRIISLIFVWADFHGLFENFQSELILKPRQFEKMANLTTRWTAIDRIFEQN